MIPCFLTDRSGQTVKTLKEQSDQDLHCLSFRMYFRAYNSIVKLFFCSNFGIITAILLNVQNVQILTTTAKSVQTSLALEYFPCSCFSEGHQHSEVYHHKLRVVVVFRLKNHR